MSDNFDITNVVYNLKERYVEEIESDLLNALMKNNKELQQGLLANYWIMHSEFTKTSSPVEDNIILVTQFYISNNQSRQSEIIECLHKNLDNNYISKIFLVTERDYTDIEMEIIDNNNKTKITQINIGERMKYSDAFDIVEQNNLNG